MLLNRAEMLNRRASQPKFMVEEVINILPLEKGETVADIGSGGGYFTMRFTEKVGEGGNVFAVDNNAKLLSYIKKYAEENQIENIYTVMVDENGVDLPNNGCDLIFLRNVFHHLENPINYFVALRTFLKPNGRVVIIDYKKRTGFNFITLLGHYVKEEFIQETMEKAGFHLVESYDFLPEQSFNIFKLNLN